LHIKLFGDEQSVTFVDILVVVVLHQTVLDIKGVDVDLNVNGTNDVVVDKLVLGVLELLALILIAILFSCLLSLFVSFNIINFKMNIENIFLSFKIKHTFI
jgi:hypothetical protein